MQAYQMFAKSNPLKIHSKLNRGKDAWKVFVKKIKRDTYIDKGFFEGTQPSYR